MHDQAVGQILCLPMMVGDDHVKAEATGQLDLFDRGNPAVNGDYESGAASRETLYCRAAQAIPLVEAVGNQPVALRTELAQGTDQEARRTDPVNVKITEDGDPFAGRNRCLDPIPGLRNAGQVGRRPEFVSGQKMASRIDIHDPPPDEGDRGGTTKSQLPCQDSGAAEIVRRCFEQRRRNGVGRRNGYSNRSSCLTPIHQIKAIPRSEPGTATRAVATSV